MLNKDVWNVQMLPSCQPLVLVCSIEIKSGPMNSASAIRVTSGYFFPFALCSLLLVRLWFFFASTGLWYPFRLGSYVVAVYPLLLIIIIIVTPLLSSSLVSLSSCNRYLCSLPPLLCFSLPHHITGHHKTTSQTHWHHNTTSQGYTMMSRYNITGIHSDITGQHHRDTQWCHSDITRKQQQWHITNDITSTGELSREKQLTMGKPSHHRTITQSILTSIITSVEEWNFEGWEHKS